MKLQIENYWPDPEQTPGYKDAQIKRHQATFYKNRPRAQYERVYKLTEKYFSPANSWLCLGARNNWERDVFSELAGAQCLVESLDISPLSGTDYIIDFNNPVPAEFLEKWGVIYTNALDHAIDAGKVLLDWMSCLKENGVFIWHWGGEGVVGGYIPSTASDCCSFSYDRSIKFLKHHNIKLLYDYTAEFGGSENGGFFALRK